MKIVIAQWLLFGLMGVSTTFATKPQSTTPRTVTPTGQVVTKLTSRVPNISDTEIITDIRTPPKVKQMIKKIEVKTEHLIENSHPGLAEPIDEDIEALEDSLKKINFYKIERPTTTDSGLSTWILLSGQSKISSTRKPSLASSRIEDKKNSSVIPYTSSGTKLLFKKRPSNTSTKSTSTTPKSTISSKSFLSSVSYLENTTKPTQNKTSGLNAVMNHKNTTTFLDVKNKNTINDVKKNDTKTIAVNNKISNNVLTSTTELEPELKYGDIELPSSTANPKKSRRPTNKKKKDKNRRKRPSVEGKDDLQNKTKISNKISQKEKPITTQIYNYLAREVMPTVGVGLVGLVVTAGLASYFLYPFGSLRRSYEIERKDKDFYYYDTSKMTSDYDGGIAEEEAIGKVIAGMPFSSNNIHGNNYNQKSNSNNRYRHADSTFYQKLKGSVESLQPVKEYNKNDNYVYNTQHSSNINKNILPPYNKNRISQNVEASYTTNDQQFVVGNVPIDVEEITPAVVPEHGPRNLKIRKRRTLDNDVIKNEIDVDEAPQKFDEFEKEQSVFEKNSTVSVNTTKTTTSIPTKYTFVDFFKDLVTTKLRVGLELLQNQTLAFSRYLNSVQQRLYNLQSSNVTK